MNTIVFPIFKIYISFIDFDIVIMLWRLVKDFCYILITSLAKFISVQKIAMFYNKKPVMFRSYKLNMETWH